MVHSHILFESPWFAALQGKSFFYMLLHFCATHCRLRKYILKSRKNTQGPRISYCSLDKCKRNAAVGLSIIQPFQWYPKSPSKCLFTPKIAINSMEKDCPVSSETDIFHKLRITDYHICWKHVFSNPGNMLWSCPVIAPFWWELEHKWMNFSLDSALTFSADNEILTQILFSWKMIL